MAKRKIIVQSTRPPAPSACRALVWVDSSILKAEEQKKCKTLYQKLESVRKTIELHESKSVPEYQNWIHSQKGVQLTNIRELGEKLRELQQIVEAVEAHSLFTGCTHWKAYEFIMRMKSKDDEKFEDELEKEFKEEFLKSAFEESFGTKKQWRSRHDTYEEAFQTFKERISEEEDPEPNRAENESKNDSRFNQQDRGKRQHKNRNKNSVHESAPLPREQTDTQTRLKDLYRSLARKLHPDLNPKLEPKMIQLWYQVQHAYDTQDLPRLETLSSLNAIYDQSWETIDGISALKNLFQALKTSLRQLEKKINLAKKEKAWQFHQKAQDPHQFLLFKREITQELKSQEVELKNVLREFEALIDTWANPKKGDRRKKNSRPTRGSFYSEIEEFSEWFR